MSPLLVSILVLLSIVLIIWLTSILKLNAFVSLFVVSLLLAMATLPFYSIIDILKRGFGDTIATIGFIIIFGSIIAVVLEKSGGAVSIANYILKKTGQSKAAAAIGITGFVTGLPIFCDAGFIILSGIAKSFSSKTKIALSFTAVVLATSLYAVHCLVPIHPGALAASGIIEVNLAYFILLGILFAIPAALVAFFWTKWKTRHDSYQYIESETDETNKLQFQKLPSVSLSLLPILVPILLIAIASLLGAFGFSSENLIVKIIFFAGQPVIALFIGAILSFLLLKSGNMNIYNEILENAIEKAGPILIITAAGGMFGLVIKETNIGLYAAEFLVKTKLGLLVPFLIAFLLKTAQGSSTVAIITAASFVAPMLSTLGLASEMGKLLTLLAMGAGSMMISHANDSYFWVVTRFSGIEINTSLKVYSTATAVMGITVFLCVFVTSLFIG
ncbi:MAG TPA: GntP family permease [Paludibacteraceae bacterium]|nr:GntP family permease [Paludibacteraceae bacterium]